MNHRPLPPGCFPPPPPPRNPGKTDTELLQESIQRNKDQLPLLVEAVEMNAQLTKARFKAYKSLGFTEEQAMQLVLQDRAG